MLSRRTIKEDQEAVEAIDLNSRLAVAAKVRLINAGEGGFLCTDDEEVAAFASGMRNDLAASIETGALSEALAELTRLLLSDLEVGAALLRPCTRADGKPVASKCSAAGIP